MATENHSETTGISSGRDTIVQRDLVNIVNSPVSLTHAGPSAREPSFRYNLPIATPHYKGRQGVFDKMTSHFGHLTTFSSVVRKIFKLLFYFFLPAQSSSCWNQIVAVVGMGGIGKTELACQFANKYRQIYPNAAWIHAETRQSALDSFLGLAKCLRIVSDLQTRADLDLVKKVYRHINANYLDKVLIILDNAIRLKSCNKNFGIIDFLPTEDFPEQRFPFVIITTQTPDWHKGMETFQLDELKEIESIDFFRSTFKVSSPDCDEALKKLHIVLRGFPLAMTLAVSNFDFNYQKDRSSRLCQQIERYLKKFYQEYSQILAEKINKNWPSNYNETLSTVWQLSFQRLLAQPHGANAIKLLQAVSFFYVPVTTTDIMRVFIECPFCPGTPDWMQFDGLEEAIRLLQRFYAMEYTTKWEKADQSTKSFCCELEVHRLLQYVVRFKMDCSGILEDILRFLAFSNISSRVSKINMSAVEETFERISLSTRALAFIGLLACKDNQAAKRIVATRSARVDPAATIWRMCNMDRDVEVLRRFIGLSASEKALMDKRLYAGMAVDILVASFTPYLHDDTTPASGVSQANIKAIEDILCETFSTGCSFDDVCSRQLLCTNFIRLIVISSTVALGNRIIEHFTKAHQPESRIAGIRETLRKYRELVQIHYPRCSFTLELKDASIDYLRTSSKFDEHEIELWESENLQVKQYFLSVFHKIRSVKLETWKALLESVCLDIKTLTKHDWEDPQESLQAVVLENMIDYLKALMNSKANYYDASVELLSKLKDVAMKEGHSNSDVLTKRLDAFKKGVVETKQMSLDEIGYQVLRKLSKYVNMVN